ncbi:MAG: nicotinate (nicotinamide) nucleotide adenylyltransferase [Candidatus Aegiribacteria sp.]|nr:nicotinate (nicotinamide) nucleotide adenylyltransferase [Candidatus Aegiribacteria sp.]
MTGLLGGTFDPPHFGHLVLALEAFHQFDLEEVLLVPARIPPHKPGRRITSFGHRFRMTELAVADCPELTAANLEPFNGTSWTVNLIEKLSGMEMKICFIMGMDTLKELHTWKDPERISKMAKMVAGTRSGYEAESINMKYRSLVETFEIPGVSISSCDLRDRFARELNTRYLVPDSVRNYIRENGLYVK